MSFSTLSVFNSRNKSQRALNCPYIDQKTEKKQFQNCFETVLFQFHFSVRTVLEHEVPTNGVKWPPVVCGLSFDAGVSMGAINTGRLSP